MPPPAPSGKGMSYKDAGVDIDAGNSLVERIKPACKSTRRAGCDSDLGGFGGLFDLAAAGYEGKDTILVGATDGVGTKLKVRCRRRHTREGEEEGNGRDPEGSSNETFCSIQAHSMRVY